METEHTPPRAPGLRGRYGSGELELTGTTLIIVLVVQGICTGGLVLYLYFQSLYIRELHTDMKAGIAAGMALQQQINHKIELLFLLAGGTRAPVPIPRHHSE